MKRNYLVVRRPKGWVPRTTDSTGTTRIAANLLAQDFSTERIDQKWVSDITYISSDDGWLYLCAVLDLSSRRVIGYGMSKNIDAELVCDAMKMVRSSEAILRTCFFIVIGAHSTPQIRS